jgi:hypothetical protein
MRAFYLRAGPAQSAEAACTWYGKAMAYALLLRDHYDDAAGERLVEQLGLPDPRTYERSTPMRPSVPSADPSAVPSTHPFVCPACGTTGQVQIVFKVLATLTIDDLAATEQDIARDLAADVLPELIGDVRVWDESANAAEPVDVECANCAHTIADPTVRARALAIFQRDDLSWPTWHIG